MQEKIIYFEKAGKENTPEVLRLVGERARARGISKIVLASTRGDTARAALDAFAGPDIRLVVIPHQFGFGEKQRRELRWALRHQKGKYESRLAPTSAR